MKVGLISDIHGNLPALDAVLGVLEDVDVLVCAGDVVGYYADPNEVCARLRDNGVWAIRGNHDAYVLGIMEPDPEKRLAYRTDWTRAALMPENLAWLATLPVSLVFDWNGKKVTVFHASPWDETTYLYADAPETAQLSLGSDELLVVGHTHHPVCLPSGQGRLVNPGSVGQPRDWNPEACCAVLDVDSGEVEFRRARYDVAGLQTRLEEAGWDPGMISILSRTRQADTAL